MDITKSDILQHAALPAAAAGLSTLATAIQLRKSKDSTKNKLKKLLRNAALGTLLGGGLEAGRVGIKNIVNGKTDLGNTTVSGNFIEN